ncbi:MAG: Sec-independent protein translocase protein TatB, partial [Pseudolabrys sp.]
GKVRRMANEFQGQFQEALREAEFADLKKHADDISSSVAEFSNMDPLADVQKDVESAFPESPMADSAPTPAVEAASPATEAEPEPPPLPQIDVPLPQQPASVASEDFAPAAPPPAQKAGGGG